MDGGSELAGRKQGHQGSHPGAFVATGLRRPPSIGQLGSPQPVEAAARRIELARGQQSQDGVHRRLGPGRSPNVGPTAIPILFGDYKLDRHCDLAAGESFRTATSRQPSLHGTLAYLPVPAAAREQYDERYASTQPDRSLDCKFHLVPPFVVLVSLFRLPRVPARPPAFQEDHHDAPGHDPHACLQNCFSRHRLCAPFAFPPTFDIIGKRYSNTCRRPGPAATINMDGKMKKKIGNTSLAPTLPARSSASWRRRTRMKSEWVRRLSPMLVPKRSF